MSHNTARYSKINGGGASERASVRFGFFLRCLAVSLFSPFVISERMVHGIWANMRQERWWMTGRLGSSFFTCSNKKWHGVRDWVSIKWANGIDGSMDGLLWGRVHACLLVSMLRGLLYMVCHASANCIDRYVGRLCSWRERCAINQIKSPQINPKRIICLLVSFIHSIWNLSFLFLFLLLHLLITATTSAHKIGKL